MTIAWIMAVPIFDTISLMIRRILKGRNPMAADREHLHHIFLRAGFTSCRAALLVSGVSFAFGAYGVLGWWNEFPKWLMWGPLLGAFGAHYLFVRHAWRATKGIAEIPHGAPAGKWMSPVEDE